VDILRAVFFGWLGAACVFAGGEGARGEWARVVKLLGGARVRGFEGGGARVEGARDERVWGRGFVSVRGQRGREVNFKFRTKTVAVSLAISN
jgi:hypothetical protein